MEIELVDAVFVENCFADAGATLAAMRAGGYRLGMKTSNLIALDPDQITYEHSARPSRPAVPKSDRIDAMDAIFGWLSYIENRTVRRIVAGRAIVDLAGRPQSWRSIGRRLNVDHHSVKAWHAKGVATIVAALNE